VRNDDIARFEFSVFLGTDRFVGTEAENLNSIELSDDDLTLLPLRVYGFIFERRGYRPLNVHDMEEVAYRSEALDELQIDEFHKKTIQSLVHSYFKNKEIALTHSDVKTRNSGKGDGLVILFYDPNLVVSAPTGSRDHSPLLLRVDQARLSFGRYRPTMPPHVAVQSRQTAQHLQMGPKKVSASK